MKAQMEAQITVVEIYVAMKAMPRGKTLGPNNIPSMFYLMFHDLVIPLLEDIYNHACTYGELPAEFLNNGIVLIPKSRDPT